MKFQIRFDGPPGPQSGRFIEVEDDEGRSIRLGEWKQERPDLLAVDSDWLLVVDTGPSHAYCSNCEAIQPALLEPLHPVSTPSDEGNWQAGDLVCGVCAWIVATFYSPADEAVKV